MANESLERQGVLDLSLVLLGGDREWFRHIVLTIVVWAIISIIAIPACRQNYSKSFEDVVLTSGKLVKFAIWQIFRYNLRSGLVGIYAIGRLIKVLWKCWGLSKSSIASLMNCWAWLLYSAWFALILIHILVLVGEGQAKPDIHYGM